MFITTLLTSYWRRKCNSWGTGYNWDSFNYQHQATNFFNIYFFLSVEENWKLIWIVAGCVLSEYGIEQWRRKGVGYLFHVGSVSNGLQGGPSPRPLHVRHLSKPSPCGPTCLVAVPLSSVVHSSFCVHHQSHYRGAHNVMLRFA